MTSNPASDNKPTPDAQRESPKEANHPDPKVPLTSTTPKPQPPHSHYQITCKAEKNWWDKIKPYVECLGVILIGTYTGFTIAIYCANNRAANAAEKANTQTFEAERPWIGVSEFSIKPGNEKNPKNLVAVAVINGGKRPAHIQEMGVSIHNYKIFPENPSYDNPEGGKDVKPSTALLVPGVPYTFRHELRMSTADIAEFAANGETAYVYGRVIYTDIGSPNVVHTTHFCEMLILKTQDFVTCPSYNDAD